MGDEEEEEEAEKETAAACHARTAWAILPPLSESPPQSSRSIRRRGRCRPDRFVARPYTSARASRTSRRARARPCGIGMGPQARRRSALVEPISFVSGAAPSSLQLAAVLRQPPADRRIAHTDPHTGRAAGAAAAPLRRARCMSAEGMSIGRRHEQAAAGWIRSLPSRSSFWHLQLLSKEPVLHDVNLSMLWARKTSMTAAVSGFLCTASEIVRAAHRCRLPLRHHPHLTRTSVCGERRSVPRVGARWCHSNRPTPTKQPVDTTRRPTATTVNSVPSGPPQALPARERLAHGVWIECTRCG